MTSTQTRRATTTTPGTTTAAEGRAAATDVAEAGREGGSTAMSVLMSPVTVARDVAGDLATAARRPDTMLFWGGLAALAAFGTIEAPVAAAIGVGVAVAAGVRRARSAA